MDVWKDIVDRVTDRMRAIPDGPLVVGCSGGGDSSLLLCALSTIPRFSLHAVCVDHQLRQGTEREAALVQKLATARGASFERMCVDVPRHGNLLAAARTVRYRALAQAAAQRAARFVAVGHTATDQAETVLFRLARGDGRHGLAAIPAARPLDEKVTLIRPLLDVRREEIFAAARQLNLTVAADPTNEREQFARTRIRRALAENAGAEAVLCAAADRAASWIADLDRRADELMASSTLDAAAVAHAGSDVARRALRRAGLQRAGGAHAEALVKLARSTDGTKRIDLGDGFVAERRYSAIRIENENEHEHAYEVALTDRPPGDEIDLGQVLGPIFFRTRRPGDFVRTRAGRKKLQDLYTDLKIPRPERDQRLLLAHEKEGASEIFWIAGLGTSHAARPSLTTLPENLRFIAWRRG